MKETASPDQQLEMALNRLDNTERRLIKQPELREKYCGIIEQYVKKGYLEYVDVINDSNDCWYLPHFPVVRTDKSTTKVRIVFDEAARYDGKSLNDVIQPCPKLQQDLVDVLLRFRRYPVALVCDIAEMHLRIGVHPQDRPYQRVLWRSLNQSEKPKILQFTCVVFGISSSPFHAQYVSQRHSKKNKNKYPLAAETVLSSTYMDDSMDSVKTCDEAIKLYKELSELWGKTGMHARKWVTNESEVLKEIPEEDRAMEVNLKCGEFPSIKTLGTLWKASDDIFTFKDASDPCCKEDKHTKRSFLKKITTLFDPLGFFSPYVV